MTARPVPAEQDHIDAVAQAMAPQAARGDEWALARQNAKRLLATDDAEARDALLAEWAARHPTALLDALTNAGVLARGATNRDGSVVYVARPLSSDEAVALLRERLCGLPGPCHGSGSWEVE